jgi:hypothetical protein
MKTRSQRFCSTVPAPGRPSGGKLVYFLVAATAFLLWLTGPLAAASNPPPPTEVVVPPAPMFPETSTEPILLRYKFTPGDTFRLSVDIGLAMRMEVMGQSMEVPMVMSMYGELKTLSVEPNGDYRLSAVFQRVTMESSGAGKSVSFDSQKAADGIDPALKPLQSMVGVPVQVKITPTGRILETDYSLMEEALRRAGAAAGLAELTRDVDKSLHRAFTMLPEEPVRAGDLYPAGELVEAAGELGEIRGQVQYQVLAVSGDRTRALLKPILEMTFVPSPNAPIQPRLESGGMEGWILFDADKGNILQSAGSMKVALEFTQNGQTLNVKMILKMTSRTD